MTQRHTSIIRPIAVAVVMAFAAQQLAYAAPAMPTLMPVSLKPEVGFRLPESVAVVDDAYKAPGSSKLIILIQDAHTNDSGQMNVAKSLAEILSKENITTVFTEADSGDKSLSYMKPFFSQEVRESVGRSLVRKGVLRGHDYANLTGKDFTLWGVEDPALYQETLEIYKDITQKRDKVRSYVDRVQRSADVVKGDVFSDEVRELDMKRVQNVKGELSLADYAELLLKEAGKAGLSTARYPHVKFLRRLRVIEQRVDFKKASAEEREAIKVIPQADRDELLAAHKKKTASTTEENGFYSLFEEKLKGRESAFPDLAKYFAYLKETRKMNALGVVGEVKGLEEDLFMKLSKSQDEAVLWTFARNLETLQNLIALKVSPEEYDRIKAQPALYDIKLIAGFLNRKISDADKHYENALTLEDSYAAVWKDATDFYELTLKRDRVFFDRLTAKMSDDKLDKAVLITGGYHTPNLKAMFKSAGISYVSLLPQVLAETDTPRYEKLLLAQLDDKNSQNPRIASGARPARSEATMLAQAPAARLAEALAANQPERADVVQQVLAAARMSEGINIYYVDKEETWPKQGLPRVIEFKTGGGNDIQFTNLSITLAGDDTKNIPRSANLKGNVRRFADLVSAKVYRYRGKYYLRQLTVFDKNGKEVTLNIADRVIRVTRIVKDAHDNLVQRVMFDNPKNQPVQAVGARMAGKKDAGFETIGAAWASNLDHHTFFDQIVPFAWDERVQLDGDMNLHFKVKTMPNLSRKLFIKPEMMLGETITFRNVASDPEGFIEAASSGTTYLDGEIWSEVAGEKRSLGYVRFGFWGISLNVIEDSQTPDFAARVKAVWSRYEIPAAAARMADTENEIPGEVLALREYAKENGLTIDLPKIGADGKTGVVVITPVNIGDAKATLAIERLRVSIHRSLKPTTIEPTTIEPTTIEPTTIDLAGVPDLTTIDNGITTVYAHSNAGATSLRLKSDKVRWFLAMKNSAGARLAEDIGNKLINMKMDSGLEAMLLRINELVPARGLSELSDILNGYLLALGQRSAQPSLPDLTAYLTGLSGPTSQSAGAAAAYNQDDTVKNLIVEAVTFLKTLPNGQSREFTQNLKRARVVTLDQKHPLTRSELEQQIANSTLNTIGHEVGIDPTGRFVIVIKDALNAENVRGIDEFIAKIQASTLYSVVPVMADNVMTLIFTEDRETAGRISQIKSERSASGARMAEKALDQLVGDDQEFGSALKTALDQKYLDLMREYQVGVSVASPDSPVLDAEVQRIHPQEDRVLFDSRVVNQLAWMYQHLNPANRERSIGYLAEGTANAMLHIGVESGTLRDGEINLGVEEGISNKANSYGYTELCKLAHLFIAVTFDEKTKITMLERMMSASGPNLLSYHYAHPNRAGPEAYSEADAISYHKKIFESLHQDRRALRNSPTLLELAYYHLAMFATPVLEGKADYSQKKSYKLARRFIKEYWNVLPVTGRDPIGSGSVDYELQRLVIFGQFLRVMDTHKSPSDTILSMMDAWNRSMLRNIGRIDPLNAGTVDTPKDTIAFPETSSGGFTHVPLSVEQVRSNVTNAIKEQAGLNEYLSAAESRGMIRADGVNTRISREFLEGLVPFFIRSMMIGVPNGGLGTRANTVDYIRGKGDHDWVPNSAVGSAKSSMEYDGEHTILQTRLEMAAGLNQKYQLTGKDKVPVYLLNSRFTDDDTRRELKRFGYQVIRVADLGASDRESYAATYGVTREYFEAHSSGQFAVHSDEHAPIVYLDITSNVPMFDPHTGFPMRDPNEQWSAYHAWTAHLAAFDPVAIGKDFVTGANVDNLPGSSNPLMLALQAVMGNEAAVGLLPTPEGQKGGAPAKNIQWQARTQSTAQHSGVALFPSPIVEGFQMNPSMFEEAALAKLLAEGKIDADKRLTNLTDDEKKQVIEVSNQIAREYMGYFNSAVYALSPAFFKRINKEAGILSSDSDLTRLANIMRRVGPGFAYEADKRYLMGRTFLGAVQPTLLQGTFVTGFGGYSIENPHKSVMYVNYRDSHEVFDPIKAENPKNIKLRGSVIAFALQSGFKPESNLSELIAAYAAGQLKFTDSDYDSRTGSKSFTKALGDLMMTFAGVAEGDIRSQDPTVIKLKKDPSLEGINKALVKEQANLDRATASVALYPIKQFLQAGRRDHHSGARLAESTLDQGLKLIGGFNNTRTVTLMQVLTTTELKRQYLMYLHFAQKYLELQKEPGAVELPYEFILEDGSIWLIAPQVSQSGDSIHVQEGGTSKDVLISKINEELPQEVTDKLDERAVLMSQQSDGMKDADAALAGVIATAPVISLVSEAAGILKTGDTDKFDLFLKDLAVKFTRMRVLNKDLGLVIEVQGLSDAQKARVSSILGRNRDAEWTHIIDSGRDAHAADEYQQLRSRYFLVDVIQKGKSKSDYASAAVQTQASTDRHVTDWFAVGTLVGNAIKATGITGSDVEKFRTTFETQPLQMDAKPETLDAINKAFQNGQEGFHHVGEFIDAFKKGLYENRTIRMYVMPLGQMLQTMRMMVAQVAMAA